MILDTIAQSARKRVDERKAVKPLEKAEREAYECLERARDSRKPESRDAFPFRSALKKPGMSFICEVKRASPSKGLIDPYFPYIKIAKDYQEARADAISVLTEPEFFLGSDRYLEEIHQSVSIPLLRKDFTIDEYQIYEAKILGASAVLLICSLLTEEQLKTYIRLCGRLELDALVEAHTDREIAMAVEAGAEIIGINNRNLKTFEVDFSNALRLRRLVDPHTIFVAESGVRTAEDVKVLAENKVDAVLIGETLMKARDRKAALARLRMGSGKCSAQSDF